MRVSVALLMSASATRTSSVSSFGRMSPSSTLKGMELWTCDENGLASCHGSLEDIKVHQVRPASTSKELLPLWDHLIFTSSLPFLISSCGPVVDPPPPPPSAIQQQQESTWVRSRHWSGGRRLCLKKTDHAQMRHQQVENNSVNISLTPSLNRSIAAAPHERVWG